ncbi:hypothetical protein COCNU_02G010220 [Cocos nucifera]|uniref:Uncharacterized protein n=1 Tax=Cocos nucifera TaxID=13894 RepID=A0A8K0MXD3_COCNU|nr:hypothetical protein COCNU_02G010210 [Cocos nucifera]KAG1331054.1 hypothetical protein COCNU_02G010220 [Cocos nucifera]
MEVEEETGSRAWESFSTSRPALPHEQWGMVEMELDAARSLAEMAMLEGHGKEEEEEVGYGRRLAFEGAGGDLQRRELWGIGGNFLLDLNFSLFPFFDFITFDADF